MWKLPKESQSLRNTGRAFPRAENGDPRRQKSNREVEDSDGG